MARHTRCAVTIMVGIRYALTLIHLGRMFYTLYPVVRSASCRHCTSGRYYQAGCPRRCFDLQRNQSNITLRRANHHPHHHTLGITWPYNAFSTLAKPEFSSYKTSNPRQLDLL